MKKYMLSFGIFLAAVIFNKTDAQVGISVNVNIGSQPAWGPVGYDYVEYYYLPDIETYYYVPRRQFVYLSGGRWLFASSLPPAHRHYDVYNSYKVVINEPKAYMHYRDHRVKYAGFRGHRDQVIIRNSDEPKYYIVRGHPKHQSKGKNSSGPGKGKAHSKGHGKHNH